jgi:hypothetical protein
MDAITKKSVRKALVNARRAIKQGEEVYICMALGDQQYFGGPFLAREIIRQRIYPHTRLEDWVYCNVIPRHGAKNFTYYPSQDRVWMGDLRPWAQAAMREYRLRWLKELIAEFS